LIFDARSINDVSSPVVKSAVPRKSFPLRFIVFKMSLKKISASSAPSAVKECSTADDAEDAEVAASAHRNSAQLVQKQIYLRSLQRQRRQQPQNTRIVRQPGDDLLLKQRLLNRLRIAAGELDTDEITQPAHFFNKQHLAQLGKQVLGILAHVFEQVLISNHVNRSFKRGARERPAAEGRSQITALYLARDRIGHQHCSHRHSAG